MTAATTSKPFRRSIPFLGPLFWLGLGMIAGWLVFGRHSPNPSEPQNPARSASPNRPPAGPADRIATTRPPSAAPPAATSAASAASSVPAGDLVLVPRSLLKYLKADSLNLTPLEFKPPVLAALGVNETESAALNAALKTISLKTAEFQMAHAVLKQDAGGGEYYQIKPSSSETAKLLSELENLTKAALPEKDPAISGAVFSLLHQSQVLADFQFASQELAIISWDAKPSVEIKRFDDNGTCVGRSVMLATPELIDYRFPFLRNDGRLKR